MENNTINSNNQQLLRYNNDNCSICFNQFKIDNSKSTPCLHIFHDYCIKKWLKENTTCPVCKGHSTIENLTVVPKSICSRLVQGTIKHRIVNAIDTNNLSDLISVIKEFNFCDIQLPLKLSLFKLIQKSENTRLAKIVENLLTEDVLSVDSYYNIMKVFKQILTNSIKSTDNIEAIKLLVSYNLYQTPTKITSVVNKYFQAREFDSIIDIIEDYDGDFNLDIKIIKQVIREDVEKNDLASIEKIFNIIFIFKEKTQYDTEMPIILSSLVDFIEKLIPNNEICSSIISILFKDS